VSAGKVTKPVVAWVSGTCAKLFKSEVQFGHAGARSTGESDSAQVCRGSEPFGGSGAVLDPTVVDSPWLVRISILQAGVSRSWAAAATLKHGIK
jgi:hypothetical protein